MTDLPVIAPADVARLKKTAGKIQAEHLQFLTPTQQGFVLQSLSQQNAAELIGRSARWMRDRALPRNPDKTYDAAAVVRHALKYREHAELSDEDLERIEVAITEIAVGVPSGALHTLRQLDRIYGDDGLLAFVRRLLEDLGKFWDEMEIDGTPPSPAEVERQVLGLEQHTADNKRMSILRSALMVCVQCPGCEKVRHGPKWLKKRPTPGYHVDRWLCPSCEKKRIKEEERERP